MTIEEHIHAKVLPQFHPIVSKLREFMHNIAPKSTELISYGVLMWKGKRPLVLISPTKKDITFSFTFGAYFEDRYNLLRGSGKHSKFIKITSVESINPEILTYYIRQAIKMDDERSEQEAL